MLGIFVYCTHLVSVHIELGLDYKSQFCIQMCSSQMHHVVFFLCVIVLVIGTTVDSASRAVAKFLPTTLC